MSAERLAARVFAEWLDDPTECRFAFDLILDPATARIFGDWPIFGAVDLEGPGRRAFLLEADGALGFGDVDRAWRTDLREKRIAVGERFALWWSPADCGVYEIVKIAILGSKTLGRRT